MNSEPLVGFKIAQTFRITVFRCRILKVNFRRVYAGGIFYSWQFPLLSSRHELLADLKVFTWAEVVLPPFATAAQLMVVNTCQFCIQW